VYVDISHMYNQVLLLLLLFPAGLSCAAAHRAAQRAHFRCSRSPQGRRGAPEPHKPRPGVGFSAAVLQPPLWAHAAHAGVPPVCAHAVYDAHGHACSIWGAGRVCTAGTGTHVSVDCCDWGFSTDQYTVVLWCQVLNDVGVVRSRHVVPWSASKPHLVSYLHLRALPCGLSVVWLNNSSPAISHCYCCMHCLIPPSAPLYICRLLIDGFKSLWARNPNMNSLVAGAARNCVT
jgi:hypothetical protein